MKVRWAKKLASSSIYIVQSTYTGKILGLFPYLTKAKKYGNMTSKKIIYFE